MRVYVVYRPDSYVPRVIGVADTEKNAMAMCTEHRDYYIPLETNVSYAEGASIHWDAIVPSRSR